MEKKIVLPNLLTALSLCSGLFVIFKMNMIHPGSTLIHQVQSCVWIILLAAFFDVLDGAVARAMGAESDFGSFFDSMADGIAFGVAPAVLVLKTLSLIPGTFLAIVLTASAMTYSVAGILRLVRFSTTHTSPEKKKASFTGLPIPAAALSVISSVLFLAGDEGEALIGFDLNTVGWITIAIFFFLSYLMVSKWRFPSIKALNVRVSSFQLVLIVATLSPLALLVALNNFPLALLIGSWGYVLIAWSTACIKLMRGKREEALDESHDDFTDTSESKQQ